MEIKTNTLILTFNSSKIPVYIRCGSLNVTVIQYIPNPLRCYKCQSFGHTTNKCKRNLVCARCSGNDHNDQQCEKEYKCSNCKENHPSYSKKCSYYKREFDIQHIRIKNCISFFDARTLYERTHGPKVMNELCRSC